MIEHIVRMWTTTIDAPWRRIEPGITRQKRPGHIHLACDMHPWFKARIFHKGDDMITALEQADRLIAQHTDHRRLVEVSDEELRRLVDQRPAMARQYRRPAPARVRDGAGVQG